MKYNFFYLLAFLCCIACGKKQAIVESQFVDSVLNNFNAAESIALNNNEKEMQFWYKRIDTTNVDLVNYTKYAGSLISLFHLKGNVNDIKKADSILWVLSKAYNNTEASVYLSLSSHYTLQHRFKEADSVFQIAKKIGLKKYDLFATEFDIDFEMGRFLTAEEALKNIKFSNDYGYQFRLSKLLHYKGNVDSSIAAMQRAVELASSNATLQQIALSNLADLYLHSNNITEAYSNYKKCLQTNAADIHSLMGIGWIALLHDNNDTTAQKIFAFASKKSPLPDAVFKLIAVAQQKKDTLLELEYAKQFESIATQKMYGSMYTKYLLQLHTQILHKPQDAVDIALRELDNRATPQTYAWYVYALACNNQLEQAKKIYDEYVVEKPLEGLESYWMGKFMIAQKKGYNAKQYFEDAAKSKYDLLPNIMSDINKQLK